MLSIQLNQDLTNLVQTFSEHYHDAWAKRKFENGWNYGETWSDEQKLHPRLKPYHMLGEYERERYREPIRDSLKALVALNWNIEYADYDSANANRSSLRRSTVGGSLVLGKQIHLFLNVLIKILNISDEPKHSIRLQSEPRGYDQLDFEQRNAEHGRTPVGERSRYLGQEEEGRDRSLR